MIGSQIIDGLALKAVELDGTLATVTFSGAYGDIVFHGEGKNVAESALEAVCSFLRSIRISVTLTRCDLYESRKNTRIRYSTKVEAEKDPIGGWADGPESHDAIKEMVFFCVRSRLQRAEISHWSPKLQAEIGGAVP